MLSEAEASLVWRSGKMENCVHAEGGVVIDWITAGKDWWPIL